MVPFTPRLILAILPNLAHDVPMLQSAGVRTNKLLLSVVQALPSPADTTPPPEKPVSSPLPTTVSPTPTSNSLPTKTSLPTKESVVPVRDVDSPDSVLETPLPKPRSTIGIETPKQTDVSQHAVVAPLSRPDSPNSAASITVFAQPLQQSIISAEKPYGLDYPATVNALTIQFLSDHEQTRVAALKWLIMLHQKSPKVSSDSFARTACLRISLQILAMDDGTFPALLKTLSDSSEEVSRLVDLSCIMPHFSYTGYQT